MSILWAKAGRVSRIVLVPFADISTAIGERLQAHIKRELMGRGVPITQGLVVHVTYPDSVAGTLYRVARLEGEPGLVDELTEVAIEFTTETMYASLAEDITYEDIGGLGRQLRLVRELVEVPLRYPERYRALGITPPKGVIFFGPPGTGKTHMARALANEVQARFFHINGPDIVSAGYGETEGNLRRIFSEATHHAPSVIVIDELDALAPKRGQVGSHWDTRVVTQLLSVMDGLKRSDGVIVLGTTNRLESVDVALRRPGRFDREVFFAPPDAEGRYEILQVHTREMPLENDAIDDLRRIAELAPGFVGADLMELCRESGLAALRRTLFGSAPPSLDAHHDLPLDLDGAPEPVRVTAEDFRTALRHVRPSAARETLAVTTNVRWSDVGGLDGVKARLRELIQLPIADPDLFRTIGLQPPTGVLLYGPPGCGKTLLARALATECNANFIPVDGPEIFSQWLGESEEALRHVFLVAVQLQPSIIFIDQLDAIAPRRRGDDESGALARVVNQLLAELDGLEALSGTVVLAATNRPDMVDASVLRPGRIGTRVYVGLPGSDERQAIVEILLRGVDIAPGVDRAGLAASIAARTERFSGAEIRHLVDEAKLVAIRMATESSGPLPALRPELFDEALRRFRGMHGVVKDDSASDEATD
ncbi:MAG: AAA family ATPase [Candidatus Limnocylindria bacterium]